MFGLTLILTLAIVGGIIAYIGDKLGYKLGKKRLSVFGLRPKHTSTLIAITSGILIASATLISLSIVSVDVRTALFGIDKLKKELSAMTQEIQTKNSELDSAQNKLEKSSAQIKKVNDELSAANQERDKAQTQLEQVTTASKEALGQLEKYRIESQEIGKLRDRLQQEVKMLTDESKQLEQGIINLREGQVIFRAGQILYQGIVPGGQNSQTTNKTLEHFLTFANKQIVQGLNLKDQDLEILFVTKEDFNQTANYLEKTSGQIALRLQTAGNIILGEPVIARFFAYPNKKIYDKNQILLQEILPDNIDKRASETLLISFLSRLNKQAVQDGVLSDPLTGNVGNLDIAYIMETVEKIRTATGKLQITARAEQDIYTIGPLQIKLIVDVVQ